MASRLSGNIMGSLTGPELTVPTGSLRLKRQQSDTANNLFKDGSYQASENGQLVAKAPNTYNMEPEVTFKNGDVERLTEAVLIDSLQDVTYDAHTCKDMSQELAVKIMDKLKSLRMKRYKLVAVVSVGSINERPGMQFGSRCLWNNSTDSFASVKFTNGSLFAVAMIYGLYFE